MPNNDLYNFESEFDADSFPANITEDEIPRERISSADAARSILTNLLQEDNLASAKRAKVQGMIDGNSPYSEDKLRKLNLESTVNVNWGHLEAKIEQACIPYFDLLTSVEHYAQVSCGYGKDLSRRREYSSIISEEFDRMLKKNKSFLPQNLMMHRNLVTWAKSCMGFTDAIDWRARNFDASNVITDRFASIDSETWEYAFLLETWYVTDLYEKIRDSENAESLGWSVENSRQAIIHAHRRKQDDPLRPWEWYQTELRNNGLYHSQVASRVIEIGHLFIRDFDGRISHYIFDQKNPIEWLYKGKTRYKNFSNAFITYTDGVGNGYWSGCKGLGQKAFKYAEAMNRLNNSLIEGAILASSMMLKSQSAEDVKKLQTIPIGPMRILPPGLEFINIPLSSTLGPAMQTAGYFQNQENSQLGNYIPTLQIDRSRRQTNAELETAARDRDILTNNRVEWFMQCQDNFYQETYRRAVNPNLVEEDPGGAEALAFQQRCIDRGVPQAALIVIESVRATRSIGHGSDSNRRSKMDAIASMIPMLPENKRINVLRDSIAAIGGQSFVDKYAPELSNAPTGNDFSIAELENNAFMQGGSVVIDPNQNHYIHAVTHLQGAARIIEQTDAQQLDPRSAFVALNALGPHLMQHLEYVSRDPTRKEQFIELNRQTAELMKMVDQIGQMAQEQEEMEQQQREQQAGEIMSPEMLVAQNRIRLDNEKAESDMRIKEAKTQQQMRLKDMTTAQRMTSSSLQNIQNLNQNQNQE